MTIIGKARPKAPLHLWVVAALALCWNGYAATDFTMTQLGNRAWYAAMGFDEARTTSMLDFIASAPVWSNAAWGLGVWGGVLGSLLLLLRSWMAFIGFGASIVGVIALMFYQRTADYPPELAGMANSAIMYVVLTIALLLLAYALRLTSTGVLR